MATPGWIAADLHVHAEPSDDSILPLREQLIAFVAEGAEVLVASDHDRITDYGPAIRELDLASRVAALAGSEVTSTVRGGETPYTAGHYNAFPLRPERGAFQEGVPPHEGRRLRRVIADLRSRGALVQLNHARNQGRSENAYFEHLLAGIAFDPARRLDAEPNRSLVDPDPTTGTRDLDFDAMELVNGPSLESYRRLRADWLSLLLQGERRTATANSDSHRAREVVALARNYVRVPDDRPGAFDATAFLEALRAGRSYGTTGPLLEVELGGAGPGDRFAGRHGELRVRILAAPWVPVSRARVFVDAEVAAERTVRAGEELRLPLDFSRDACVVVEVWGEAGDVYAALAPGFTPLAFSNPILVDADGDGTWRAPGLRAQLPPALIRPGEL